MICSSPLVYSSSCVAALLLWALTVSGTVLCGHGVLGVSASAVASLGYWLPDGNLCGAWMRQRLR